MAKTRPKYLSWLLLWLLLSASSLTRADSHALLIAISDYAGTEFESLDGPLNDVELVREVLVRRFELPADNIRVVRDDEATHSGLEREFAALAERVAPGDMVYIHFSGHGSYTDDLNDDERSGQDQTWVSHGSRRPAAADEAGDIDAYDVLDDEIEGWLAAVLAKTDHVIFVSDSCHSASVTRGEGPKVRAAPPDLRPHPFGERASSPSAARAIRIGAARDVQAAAEFQHEDGTYYGLFTWHWAKALDNAAPGATWRELFQRAAALVQQSRRSNQQPQMEGDPGLLVFDGDFAARPPTVAVTRVRGGGTRAWLDAGELAGVTVGSIYELSGAADESAPPAQLEIARTGPHDSEVVVITGNVNVGDLVSEVSHVYEFPAVRVFVTADTNRADDLETVVALRRVISEELPAYELANSQATSDLVLRVVRPARDSAGEYVLDQDATLPRVDSDAAPEVWVLTPLEALVADNLRISMRDPERMLQLVQENLSKLVRVREFKNLASVGGGDALLSVEAIVMTPVSACPADATCQVLGDFGLRHIQRFGTDSMPSDLPEGTLLSFAITNEAPADYYVYLISADPDGKIEAHYPCVDGVCPDVDALIESGQNLDLFEKEAAISLGSPGEEVVKLVASNRPINVSMLEQAAYRTRGSRGEMNPLERLLSDAAHGTRGPPNPVPNRAWGTQTISVNILPADPK